MARRGRRTRWAAVAGWTVALFAAALVPSPLARRPEWGVVGPDKLLHLVGHAGYAVALVDALAASGQSDREAAALAVGLSTLQSVAAGRLQRRVRGRAFEPGDVAAGFVGAVVGVAVWYRSRDPRPVGR